METPPEFRRLDGTLVPELFLPDQTAPLVLEVPIVPNPMNLRFRCPGGGAGAKRYRQRDMPEIQKYGQHPQGGHVLPELQVTYGQQPQRGHGWHQQAGGAYAPVGMPRHSQAGVVEDVQGPRHLPDPMAVFQGDDKNNRWDYREGGIYRRDHIA